MSSEDCRNKYYQYPSILYNPNYPYTVSKHKRDRMVNALSSHFGGLSKTKKAIPR